MKLQFQLTKNESRARSLAPAKGERAVLASKLAQSARKTSRISRQFSAARSIPLQNKLTALRVKSAASLGCRFVSTDRTLRRKGTGETSSCGYALVSINFNVPSCVPPTNEAPSIRSVRDSYLVDASATSLLSLDFAK